MKAGIDFGSTLIKAAWMTGDEYNFMSTESEDELCEKLKSEGITKLNIAGIRAEPLEGFDVCHKIKKGDPLKTEFYLQVKGAKRILEFGEMHLSDCSKNYIKFQAKKLQKSLDDFLLVSVGTGTSYTTVKGKNLEFHLGNSLGGGFIQGLTNIFLSDYDFKTTYGKLDFYNPYNLYISDVLPETRSTLEGGLIISHFSDVDKDSDAYRLYCTAISTVATAIIRDIFLLEQKEPLPKDIVFIGSTFAYYGHLGFVLDGDTFLYDKTAHIPELGAYSLALGALLDEK